MIHLLPLFFSIIKYKNITYFINFSFYKIFNNKKNYVDLIEESD